MKLRYHNIIPAIMILFFTAGADYAHAEELGRQQNRLILSDNTIGFPVLKGLFDSGFFAGNDFFIQYIPAFDISNDKFSEASDFILTSDLKKEADADNVRFNIFTADSLARGMMIVWEAPVDDIFHRDSSVRDMLAFAKSAHESTVTDALGRAGGISGTVEKIIVSYNDDGSAVSGYDLSLQTGFSPAHRFFRTFAELCLLTSIGIANYWINKDANMEDWRYKYRWEDVWPRFRDGWSWDSNAFRTNTLYHLYSGAVYYQTGRSNEYGVLASTAWAFAGSLIWEYIGEWREQTSANDMIFTAFGGALFGEALTQSSIYLEECLPDSFYGHIISFLLDPMRIFNRALDRCLGNDYRVSIVFINPAAQAVMEKSK